MKAATTASPRKRYPSHEHADQHKAIRARDEQPRRRLRDAAELRASGEVACERLREFLWDLGAEAREEYPSRWKATASRAAGLSENTGWTIINGLHTTVRPETIDTVARFTGVPVRIFFDPEL